MTLLKIPKVDLTLPIQVKPNFERKMKTR